MTRAALRLAVADLRALWRTRHSSGFPWPFRKGGLRPPRRRLAVQQLVTGYAWYSPVPLWRQVLAIPARPYRYLRMVRAIARTRNHPYAPHMQDDVP